MIFERLMLPEVIRITPRRLIDARGYLSEIFKADWFRDNVADVAFVQDTQSLSLRVGTVRGLHFQLAPFAQGKLVRCIAGALFDAAVDIRGGSPTYGRWVGATLCAAKGEQLWIPAGFAHGFVTLEQNTIVHYKSTAPYSAAHERGLLWNDPDIGIDWPMDAAAAQLSEKDLRQPRLADLPESVVFGAVEAA